LAFAARLF